MRTSLFTALALAFASAVLAAAQPPDRMNYQGVLRDAAGNPLNGSVDMIFRLFPGSASAAELLVDSHTSGSGGQVAVSGGLFSVHLGGGVVTDGSAPGTYTTLTSVLADHPDVWVEVRVNGEVLSPRVRMAAAGYALNAATIEGMSSDSLITTLDSTQQKNGKLVVNSFSVPGANYGIEGYGAVAGGRFGDADGSGYVLLGAGDHGIQGYGTQMGGYFQDSDSGAEARVAWEGVGIHANGPDVGAVLFNSVSNAGAYVGFGNDGLYASGTNAGGVFYDSNSSGQAYVGFGDVGVSGSGSLAGVAGSDRDGTGTGYLGDGDHGVRGYGSFAGGYFKDSDGSGEVFAGYHNTGIRALGSDQAGYFKDSNNASYAEIATGDWGIRAYGETVGALFQSIGGTGSATIASSFIGIAASGSTMGAAFSDVDSSGRADLAVGNVGIDARGSSRGGVFSDTNSSSWAWLASGDIGIEAHGNTWGGYFANDASGAYTSIATGNEGIAARGTEQGGYFADLDSGTNGRVAYGTSTITGTGTKNFVQNHPADPTTVIQYTALEGDEVGTYTRGTARLSGGEARVALGETFRWVTNPEVGLTAHLTPRGAAVPLAVASLTTDEIVVRGPQDVVFDYVVMGLRIGFERAPVVRMKDAEAFLPSRVEWDATYAGQPELARLSAGDRFRTMARTAGVPGAAAGESAGALERALTPPEGWVEEGDRPRVTEPSAQPEERGGLVSSEEVAHLRKGGMPSIDPGVPARGLVNRAWLPAAVAIAAGEVVAFDPDVPGRLRPAASLADPTVMGIAAGPSQEAPEIGEGLMVPVALGGIVEVRVDAGYGMIRPGDLLTSSPTPGHAMRAMEAIPGTIIGKASQGWPSATGTIDVLVMPPR